MLQWTWECMYLFDIKFQLPSDKHSGGGLLNHILVLFLSFWGSSILFSIVVVTIDISIQCTGVPPAPTSSLTLISYLFDERLSNRYEFISVWFWFAFPWWLVMLNIFLHVPFGDLHVFFFKCLFSSSAHFKRDFYFIFFYCWVVWIICSFWMLTPYQIYDLQYSLSFCRLHFRFVDGFFHYTELFSFM